MYPGCLQANPSVALLDWLHLETDRPTKECALQGPQTPPLPFVQHLVWFICYISGPSGHSSMQTQLEPSLKLFLPLWIQWPLVWFHVQGPLRDKPHDLHLAKGYSFSFRGPRQDGVVAESDDGPDICEAGSLSSLSFLSVTCYWRVSCQSPLESE